MQNNFFKNKKIFLTGHTGFKGSWASLVLKNLGAEIYGYALPPENFRGSMFDSLRISELIDYNEFGDIRDFQKLNSAIQKFKPEIILHLAAQPIVLRSYDDPVTNFETNLMGLVNLFEACRKCNSVKIILNVTSDKCYENNEDQRDFIESDKLGGKDPYSASKACAEIISNSYRESFFNDTNIEIATARAGNVIGGGDFSENRLVPDIFDALSKNQKIIIRNPNAIRPWQHVLESIFGYLLLIYKINSQPKTFNQAYNFGPNAEEEKINVENLTKIFLQNFSNQNKFSYEIISEKNAHYEAKFLGLNNNKARNELSWKPNLSPKQAIKLTADWYKFYVENKNDFQKLRNFTLSQIEGFSAIV